MSKIDPRRSWHYLDARIEEETNPIARTLLGQVRDHMEAEITGRIDALMATLSEHPVYHFWGHLPEAVLEGRDAVRGFYTDMFARGGEQFEVITRNVIADEGRVVTEGEVRQLYRGEDLLAVGVAVCNGDAIDPRGLYLGTNQLITAWPNDGHGKLVGEDIYFGQPVGARLERVSPSDLAPEFSWHERFMD